MDWSIDALAAVVNICGPIFISPSQCNLFALLQRCTSCALLLVVGTIITATTSNVHNPAEGSELMNGGTTLDCFVRYEDFERCCCEVSPHDAQNVASTACPFSTLQPTMAFELQQRCCRHLLDDCPSSRSRVGDTTALDCFATQTQFVYCCCSTRPLCFDSADLQLNCCDHGLRTFTCPNRGDADCWDDGYGPELCCDTELFGPWGNQNCWHDDSDFLRCCRGHADIDSPTAIHARTNFVKTRTAVYWEKRYSSGGTSNGQRLDEFGKLSAFYVWRTHLLQDILEHLRKQIHLDSTNGEKESNFHNHHGKDQSAFESEENSRRPTLLDLGFGDGQQMLALSCTGTAASITGLDVSWYMVRMLKHQLQSASHMCLTHAPIDLYWYDGFTIPAQVAKKKFDVVLSLQVIIHLLEQDLFDRYMTILFSFALYFVIVHAPDVDAQLQRIGHMRYRSFSHWVASHRPDWLLLSTISIPEKFGLESYDGIHLFARRLPAR